MSTSSSVASSSSPPFWLGGLSSCIAASVTHPLDLLKVRLQINTANTKAGFISTIVGIINHEGLLSFYSGLSASLLRQATYSTVRFGVYEQFKSFHTKNSSNNNKISIEYSIIYSLISGAMGGIAGNPADIVNVRMQNDKKLPLQERRNYDNVFDGLYRIVLESGIISLYNGLGPNIMRAMLMTTGQLASYDIVKYYLLHSQYFLDNPTTHFCSSLIAGGIATAATQPIDVVKTRVMNMSDNAKPNTTIVAKNLYFSEGLAGFYKGFIPAFIRLAPQTIITFMAFEKIKQLIKTKNT